MKLLSRRKPTNPVTDVVAVVARQTSDAENLAAIAGQERLTDPRTNPAVRAHADRLRDEQQRRKLDDGHNRELRRLRVFDNRAESAERALEALRAARETASPSLSVLALHRGRTRFMGISLTASLSLSVGSAIGVAALAEKLHAHAVVGYIAEVGLTGLTTTVILYKSHLAQHGEKALTGGKAAILWLLMVGPLIASMAANLFGSGPVGVACSVGAAAFALLSYVIADASADALNIQAKRVTNTDEADLRAIASSQELFSGPAETPANSPASVAVVPRDHRMTDDDLVSLGYESARAQDWLASRGVELPSHEVARVLSDTPRSTRSESPAVAMARLANLQAREPALLAAPIEPEVHEPARQAAPTEPRFRNQTMALPWPTMRTANHQLWWLNREPRREVREPVRPPSQKPAAKVNREPRTANFSDKAAKKAAEVQQVLDLIEELGRDAVTLPVVLDRFKFTKTLGYHRLLAARELWNQRPTPQQGARTGS